MSAAATENGKPLDAFSTRAFTWQELSLHNTPSDAYIAIRGKVYDVTNFIQYHPGGEDTLLLAAGRDVTVLFESYHQLEMSERLKKYEIGYLLTNELPIFPAPSQFYITLKKRVKDYFLLTGQDPKNNTAIWIRYGLNHLAFFLAYYFQFYSSTVQRSLLMQICASLALGFLAGEIALHSVHDACHFAVSHSPFVWKAVVSSYDFINGTAHLPWMYQHVLGHHPYTNIHGADPDVTTSDPGFWRIKHNQKWYFHYAKQNFIQPIFYGLLIARWRLEDYFVLFTLKKQVNIRVNPVSTKDFGIFWTGKAFFLIHRFILPLMFSPYSLKEIFLFLVVADLMYSYWLMFVFQASHVVDEAAWPLPNESNYVDVDWAKMQVITTQDYAYDSKFWTLITGALNYQSVHHLFPEVNQHYYPKISKIVRETCEEFGIYVVYKKTFLEAVSGHLKHLKIHAQDPRKLK